MNWILVVWSHGSIVKLKYCLERVCVRMCVHAYVETHICMLCLKTTIEVNLHQYVWVKLFIMGVPGFMCICLMCTSYLEFLRPQVPCWLEDCGLGLESNSTLAFVKQCGRIAGLLGMGRHFLLTHEVSKVKLLFVVIWCSFMWSSLLLLIACESTTISRLPGRSGPL